MQNGTKELIAQTLLRMTRQKALSKISVQDIATACGINRGTFYYHFLDKQELINWIYHTYITLPLREKLERGELSNANLGYFTVSELYKQKHFYCQAFKMTEQNDLCKFAQQEIVGNWELFVSLLAKDRGITDVATLQKWQAIGNMIALGSYHILAEWARNDMKELPQVLSANMDRDILPYMEQMMDLPR